MGKKNTIINMKVPFQLLSDLAESDGPQFLFCPETQEQVDGLEENISRIMAREYGTGYVKHDGEDGEDLFRFYNGDWKFSTGRKYILVFDFFTFRYTVFDLVALYDFLCVEYKFIEDNVESAIKETRK